MRSERPEVARSEDTGARWKSEVARWRGTRGRQKSKRREVWKSRLEEELEVEEKVEGEVLFLVLPNNGEISRSRRMHRSPTARRNGATLR
jgi:hypothetical protein